MKLKKLKQAVAGMLAAAMLVGLMPSGMTTVWADEVAEVMVNPLYEGVMTVEELQEEFSSVYEASVKSCSDFATAGKYVCEQMVNRATSISFTIPVSEYNKYGSNFSTALLDEAMKIENDTYKGRGGDALKFGYTGVNYSATVSGTSVQVNLKVGYYTTAAEEAELTKAVNTAMAEMKLDKVSDPYEDIKIIHDYICNHVDYNWGMSKYSAYDALCTGTSVCQGYAVAFYRLCSEAGYPVRIVSGTGNGEAHAWNIVKVNGKYYNVDCTWDGQVMDTFDDYLLKSERDFTDHIRDEEYTTWNFINAHPMADESYLTKNFSEAAFNTANPSVDYLTINNTTVSSAAQNGKAKLIMFISTECGNSKSAVQSVANTDMGNVDIIVADANKHTCEQVTAFKNTYGNDKMTFSYHTGNRNSYALWDYATIAGYTDSVTFPVIAYIDANNKVQNVTTGPIGAGEIKSRLSYYCGQSFNNVVGIEELYFMENKAELNVGAEYQLEVCMNPVDADLKQQTYESSNTKIATVSSTGKVKTLAGGTATITAIAVDKNGKTLTTKCTVTVKGASNNTGNNNNSNNNNNNNNNNNTVDKNFTGLKNEGGTLYYYENGVRNTSKYGFIDFDGGKFLVANGKVVSDMNGLANDPQKSSDWYYLANGQAQIQYTGLVLYDGAWFYVSNGKLDTTISGYVEYDGGLFYVAAGQLKAEVNGLAQDAGTGLWYYLANGQVQTQYTGLALYDNTWFYVVNGALASDYIGYVEYDGSTFYVVNGMLQM